MGAMLVGLLLLCALDAPLVAAAPLSGAAPAERSAVVAAPAARIFFAPLRVGDDVDGVTRQAIEGAVLIAAKKRGHALIASGDLQAVLDVEAAKQAAGCTADSCAAELADALGAPELLTGQVARLGDTWVLTLTHLERANMQVLGRAQVSRTGTSAAVLLDVVDGLLAEVFPAPVVVAPPPSSSPLIVPGVVTGVGGVVVAGLGAGLWIVAAGKHAEGKAAVDDGKVDVARDIREQFEGVYYAGIIGVGVGVAAVVVGAGLVGGGLLSQEGL